MSKFLKEVMSIWIAKYMSNEEIQKIADIVKAAESNTEGEIVPVIVRRSSAIGHVKWILTAMMTLVFVICETIYVGTHWDRSALWFLPPLAFLIFYFISRILAQSKWIQRVFTDNDDEILQTQNRAELEFYRTQIKKTKNRTGILLFVSWMERRVVVMADEGISKHYPQETWDEVVSLMTAEFKNGNLFAGFEKAIVKCGKILQEKLPAAQHNTNELANQLIIKE